MAIGFEPDGDLDNPGGRVLLNFAGGATIRLQVERIEAALEDLGPAWRVKSMPRHPDGNRAAKRET